ncbi:hypothetical protein DMA11_08380 [Marinilabiliaceae bacterium JC017]|nr:hypothetical protein DMA11_08380 [Marinilabiliaceae bacterium JC017]
MIFKTIHNNSILAYALMPLILGGLWAKALLTKWMPEFPFDQLPMPLWNLVLSVVKGNHLYAALFSLGLALINMMAVNRLVNRYGLLNKQSVLPGYIYLILVSGYGVVQHLQPVWFYSPLLILALERLFTAAGQRRPMSYCFDAAFWLSTGTLFYAKGIFLIPFIWAVIFILRMFSFRTFLASIIGLILPYFFAFCYYFWIGKQVDYFAILMENFMSPVAFFEHSIVSKAYNVIIIGIIIFSILSLVRQMPTFKIITRKHYRIFIWLIVICLLGSMTPYFSLEIISVMAIGGAVVLAQFFSSIQKNIWQEVFLIFLLVITLVAQYFI